MAADDQYPRGNPPKEDLRSPKTIPVRLDTHQSAQTRRVSRITTGTLDCRCKRRPPRAAPSSRPGSDSLGGAQWRMGSLP